MGNTNACGGDGVAIAMLKSTFADVGGHLCNIVQDALENCFVQFGSEGTARRC